MRRVVVESPYAGETQAIIDANVAYAKRAVMDCLRRSEAPIASHLLFTQEGILRDVVREERRLGIDAGFAWMAVAHAVVLYLDRGESPGMVGARARAKALSIPVEERYLPAEPAVSEPVDQ